MDFEKAKTLCINGDMTMVDAAYECGMSKSHFYTLVRQDKESYLLFLSNTEKRSRLKSQHLDPKVMARKYKRQAENEEENRLKKLMKKYHSKTLGAKVSLAKQLGISYGKFMAMAQGLGRLSDEA
jgi:hypothetical protein